MGWARGVEGRPFRGQSGFPVPEGGGSGGPCRQMMVKNLIRNESCFFYIILKLFWSNLGFVLLLWHRKCFCLGIGNVYILLNYEIFN